MSKDVFAAPPQTRLEELTALPRPRSWIWGRERSGEGKEEDIKGEGRGWTGDGGGRVGATWGNRLLALREWTSMHT